VIIYRLSPMTYLIGKRLIRVDHIGICNIVADRRVVREMIQHEAEPGPIAEEVTRMLTDSCYTDEMRNGLALVRERLGGGGGSARVAAIVLDMLD
jgi:lipid-A-disaccharide synthase